MDRLAKLKRRYDPSNFFRHGKGVIPLGRG
ncbi:MAG: hypothetical protein EHM78_11000 [Myxococcaceae bacterium]|nr:MAG: hypothetical protein EHM78_11000 [Myxococcaceae bacterium]